MTLAQSVADEARKYARNFRGMRAAMVSARPRICPFEDIVAATPEGATVLDIGCGSGFLLYLMSRLRGMKRGVGVEAHAATVASARRALGESLSNAEVDIIEALTFEDWPVGPFDVVTLIDVMHHVDKDAQWAFLDAAASRVRPGGLLIYKDIRSTPFWFAWANRMHDLIVVREWVQYVPISKVGRRLVDLGFSVEQEAQRVMLWYGHELLVTKRSGGV